MKIYFTCSTAEFAKYRETYYIIRNLLIENGHILTRDWIPHTEARLMSGDTEVRDIKEIYIACLEAIQEANLVTIDDTVSNFSTGHQITLALQYRKPTLVLWQGKKYRQFKQMFIHGISSDLLQISEYSKGDLEEIIQVFINKYEDFSEKNRFHLVLDNLERRYLDWAQYVRGKSRTQIIKDALKNEIELDEDYRKYLYKKK